MAMRVGGVLPLHRFAVPLPVDGEDHISHHHHSPR